MGEINAKHLDSDLGKDKENINELLNRFFQKNVKQNYFTPTISTIC
jgi:hypothetical protein